MRNDDTPSLVPSLWGVNDMAAWLILLIAALVAAIIGFGTAAKWLFIVAIVLLLVGLFLGFGSRRGAGR